MSGKTPIVALMVAALASGAAAPAAASELLSRTGGGSSLGAADRGRDAFTRQQLESDLRAAQNRRIVREGRRPSQLAIGLDNPRSDGFADFRNLESEIRRLERRERTLETRTDARRDDASTRVETRVIQPAQRAPFPDAASFAVPPALAGVDVPGDAPPPDIRAFVNRLLRANEDRDGY